MANGRVERALAVGAERSARRAPRDPRRTPQQELAAAPVRPRRGNPLLRDPLADPEERVLDDRGAHELVRDEGAGHAAGEFPLRAVERDGTGEVVELGDGPDRRLGPRIVDPAALFHRVVLGREPEALESRASAAGLAEVGVEREHPDRIALVDEVRVGHAAELVVVPPERLVLAAVPAHELREEPRRALLLGRRRGGEVEAVETARQGRHRVGHPRGPARGLGRLGRLRLGRRSRDRDPEPLPEALPAQLQPVAQAPRAQDVVAVVARDLAEDLVTHEAVGGRTEAQPHLELDDAAARVLEGHLPVKAVERLETLDRVALDAGPDALAHDAIEIDEHPAPEEPVHLLLARGVALGQASERGLLVRRVVVHVQGRVGVQAPDHEVDRLLEGGLLRGEGDEAVGVEAPEGMELRRRRPRTAGRPPRVALRGGRVEDAEQVVDPVVERERIALEVEEQVVRRRLREDQESSVGDERPRPRLLVDGPLRVEQLPEHLAAVLALDLDPGLLAHPGQRGIPAAVEPGPQRELERGEAAARADRPRRHVRRPLLERAALPARDPGDEAQVVIGPPAIAAGRPPAAHVAMGDGVRVGVRGRVGRCAGTPLVGRGQEVCLHAAVVGHEVVDAEHDGLAYAPAEGHVEPLWLPALDPGQLVDVRADLDDGRRLDVPGELGVGHLVMPGAEGAVRLPGRVIDAEEEVRVTAPGAVEEGRLVDDVRPVEHGAEGELRGLVEAGPRVRGRAVARDLDNPPAGCPEVGQVALLVLVPARLDELDGRVAPDGLRDQAGQRRPLELEAVPAGEVAHEVGRGVDGSTVDELHAVRMLGAGGARLSGAFPGGRVGAGRR